MDKTTPPPAHFKGKDALHHVAEAQAEGIIASTEIHGVEIPGHLAAATDAARESAILLALLFLFLHFFHLDSKQMLLALTLFSTGWLIWKAGRSARLGWSRLERLHRLLEQEKWEIDHNRTQEKEELTALYYAKGFRDKLLEEIIEVLMADGDRLLRVMVEDELGLKLENQVHPLKQGLFAALGVLFATLLCLFGFFLSPEFGLLAGTFAAVALTTAYASSLLGNRMIHAIVWNLALSALSIGTAYFLFDYFSKGR